MLAPAASPDHEALRRALAAVGPVVVGFSGGADSALLAHVAHEVHGSAGCLALTAVSPSLPADELAACEELAAGWGLRWEPVATRELDDPRYAANDGDRCYWCKTALLDAAEPRAAALGATVVLGVNVDDLADHRPGQRAAQERGARFPLVEAGLTKARVRELSRLLGLPTADKPAAACLASRVPYGTPVTFRVLREVEAAEAALRSLGLDELRVRHHGDVARIEVPTDRFDEVVRRRTEVVEAVLGAGYRFVALDLEGLRSGSLNRALVAPAPPTAE
ncbi:MAG: ATP-dependent sacrificial sulfur transferase LarE [Acidimicrobiales bacterium]